jgi:RNA polymerase sigma-70 factor (sigma-E family)
MVVEMGAERPWSRAQAAPQPAEEALSRVFRERYSLLVGLARLLLDDRGLAEEVVQEAFVRTLARWDRLRESEDPFPYVQRAVVNLARSGLRRRLVRRRRHLTPDTESSGADAPVVADESRREVLAAVRALPRRQQECVVLRYYLDYSTEETAGALGISEGSVKTHLHRALAAMQKTLEGTR